ncbi:unnamed protein product [Paramecium primaurelia]|uniref:Yippee domain-containing protein n=1 Tax=Paramecium primaurelia TaxID=5886 RepID=A0A8S1LJN9_PARPR|nr:unnamed protein product [Paramecium primaurelia]
MIKGGIVQAFLFEKGIKYHVGQPEDKDLKTGKHIVQDVICNCCNKVIGWKYVLRIVLILQLDQKHIESRRNIKRERQQQKDIIQEELNGADFIIQILLQYEEIPLKFI